MVSIARNVLVAFITALIAGSAHHVLAQDQFSGGSNSSNFSMDNYHSYTELSSKADKVFAEGNMAEAAELYAKAVRFARTSSIVDIPCWYKFLKAAKASGNAELLKEARADVAEMRAEPNSLFSDPYRGIKRACLILKNVPGSKWDGASSSVRERLEIQLRKRGITPVISKQAGSDTMMIEITSDTRKPGKEQYNFKAYRADSTHYLASGYGYMVAPIEDPNDIVTALVKAIDQFAESVHEVNVE